MDNRMRAVLLKLTEWVKYSGRSNFVLIDEMEEIIKTSSMEAEIEIFQKEDTLEIIISRSPHTRIKVVRYDGQSASVGVCIGESLGDPNWIGSSEEVIRTPVDVTQLYHQLRYLYALGRQPEFRGSFVLYESYYDKEKRLLAKQTAMAASA